MYMVFTKTVNAGLDKRSPVFAIKPWSNRGEPNIPSNQSPMRRGILVCPVVDVGNEGRHLVSVLGWRLYDSAIRGD